MSSFYPTLTRVVDSNYETRDGVDTDRQSRGPYERVTLIQKPCDYCGLNHNPIFTNCN